MKEVKISITQSRKETNPRGGLPGLEDGGAPVLPVVHATEGEVELRRGGGDNPQEGPRQAVKVAVSGVHGITSLIRDTLKQVHELRRAGYGKPDTFYLLLLLSVYNPQ